MGEVSSITSVDPGEEVITLSDNEYKMVMSFIRFIRGRNRGIFQAKIVTNNQGKNTSVIMEFTDQEKIDWST